MSHDDGSGTRSGLVWVLAGVILVLAMICLFQQRTIQALKERVAVVHNQPAEDTSTPETPTSLVEKKEMADTEQLSRTNDESSPSSDRETVRNLKREIAILRQERDIWQTSNLRLEKEMDKLRTENSQLAIQIAGLKAQPARHGAWIGVLMGSPTLEDPEGVAIGAVIPYSPADKAKLKKDDLIISIDGETVSTQSGVVKILSQKLVGVPITLRIKRQGAFFEVVVETVGGPL